MPSSQNHTKGAQISGRGVSKTYETREKDVLALKSIDFDFNAGDIIQVRRESGTTNLNNGQAILWVKFNNG